MSLFKGAKSFLQTIMGLEKFVCKEWSYNSKTLKVLPQKYLVANMSCAANNDEEKKFWWVVMLPVGHLEGPK